MVDQADALFRRGRESRERAVRAFERDAYRGCRHRMPGNSRALRHVCLVVLDEFQRVLLCFFFAD